MSQNLFVVLKRCTKVHQISRSLATSKVLATPQNSKCPPASKDVSGDVPGLTKAVVNVPSTPVGPGASKDTDYKNPEYFSYNTTSYFEAEVEMANYRCPQPSVHEYFEQK